jgi:hypothetical protein
MVTAKSGVLAGVTAAAVCAAAVLGVAEYLAGPNQPDVEVKEGIRWSSGVATDPMAEDFGGVRSWGNGSSRRWSSNESVCNISGIMQPDRCDYVTEVVACEMGSRVPYLEFPYCVFSSSTRVSPYPTLLLPRDGRCLPV